MKYLLLSFLIIVISNCVSTSLIDTEGMGSLYSDVTKKTMHPKQGSSHKVGKKFMKSCSHRVLYLIAIGNNGIIEPAAKAGLTKIYSIDENTMSILSGIYFKKCTIIGGE